MVIDQYLMPLDRQFDSGFRSLADSFLSAAEELDKEDKISGYGISSSPLPIFYLYRHALELFLKSALVTVHRRFTNTYPEFDTDNFPEISSKSIKNIHSIEILMNGLKSLLEDNQDVIKKIARTDWFDIPTDFLNALKQIHNFDVRSDVFRYPVTAYENQDNKKSSYKNIDLDDLSSRLSDETEPAVIFAYKNERGELIEAFEHNTVGLQELHVALRSAVQAANGIAIGLHAELVGRQD